MSPWFQRLSVACLTLVLGVVTARAQTGYVNFEGKQTRPVCLSPDGTRLFAVNTPDARLSVFDVTAPSNPILIAEIPVGLEPVSVNARSADEAWVVNEVSDSVSIVSVSRGIVTATLAVKDEPVDVVFAGGRAFVSASRNNRVTVFDVASHALLTNIAVFGESPRALAVSPDATKVYAAFALSGNRTTILPVGTPGLPAQPPPTNPNLPAPPAVSLIVDAADPAWTNGAGAPIKFTLPDHDVVEIDVALLRTNRYFRRTGTVNLGLAVHPVSGDLFVANTEAGNRERFEPVVRGRFSTNRLSRVAVATGAVTPLDLDPPGRTNAVDLFTKSNALAQPTGVVFDPLGNHLWLAAFGSDRVAKLDTNGAVLARIEVGPTTGAAADARNKRGPRGLALHAVAGRLYVLNRLANSLTVIDANANTVLRELPVGSHDPTTPAIRQGRGFLYDARLSGNGTVSCASCHIDAEMDMLAWDLGDPGGEIVTMTNSLGIGGPFPLHPMKGPMTTQTLRGLRDLDPLHWRGDRTNFMFFNGAFDGLLGGSTLPGADMAAYRDYIHTVVFQPNPNQNADRTFPTSFAGGNAEAGRIIFFNTNNSPTNQYVPGTPGLSCVTCHSAPSGSNRQLIPAAALQEPQDFKVPHLRNMYQKLSATRAPGAASIGGFGFIHDGTIPDLVTFLSQPVFGTFAADTAKKAHLNAFLQCFDTGLAPAVGLTRTLNATNLPTAAATNDWNLLEAQAVATNIDFILKGTLDGVVRGLLYQPASNNYLTDRTGVGPFTRAQLAAKIQAGDVLSLLGVPPGTGVRAGLDRDSDGILDGDEPVPVLNLAGAAGDLLLKWPTNDFGFVLESSDALTPVLWSTVLRERGRVGPDLVVTNASSNAFQFFRLRRPW